MNVRPLGMLLAVSAGISICSVAAGDEALEAARARWRTAALDAYEYGYHKYCDCHRESPPETIVTVRGNEVVGVRHRPVGFSHEVPADPKNLQFYWTVEGLFDLIASAEQRGVTVRTAYDAQLGYPTEIFIDYDAQLIGDELDLRLTRVDALVR
jgi:hypothetical protein